jgi:hypothetical protein
MEIKLLIFMNSMIFGYFLAVPNLCQILFAKRSGRFKLVHFGVFFAYLIPMLAPYAGWRSLRLFIDGYGLFIMPIIAVLHFIYLLFACHKPGIHRAWTLTKFTASLFVMTVTCTIAWQGVVSEYLYDCTDENMAGFLTPGDWVYGSDGQPIVVVDKIIHGRSPSESDTIKRGWSVTGLWCLWVSCLAVSLMVSIVVARVSWIPGRMAKVRYEPAPDAASQPMPPGRG